MRLLSLDLDRYGPFRERRIAFRPDARLHVVFGRNEAGKSRALAAVGDLLFGAETKRGSTEELLLRAEIEARDGRRLAFRRRQGRRNTLGNAEGGVLPDDALAPFLGGLTRSVFTNAFGLDAASLRAGALDMLRSEGEIGTTLFAAASGLRNIREAAGKLKAEAEALFTPASRSRPLNDLLKEYQTASAAARAERIGQDGWRRIEDGLDEAASRLDQIARRRQEIARETSRLRRLKAAAPILFLLDRQRAELEAFADLPDLAEAEVAGLAEAAAASAETGAELASREAALARAQDSLAEIAPDTAIASWREAIEALGPQSGAYQKAAQDLPAVQAEADRFDRGLSALAGRLGFADADEMWGKLPGDVTRADLRQLLQSGRELAAAHRDRQRGLERLRADLATLRRARESQAPIVDVPALRLAHEALRPALDEIGRRDALREDVSRGESELARAASRTRPALDPSMLGTLPPLPSPETIARHGEMFANATRERDRLRDDLGSRQSESAKITARMRTRLRDGDIPDRERLLRERRDRDAAWAVIREAALGSEAPRRREPLLEAAGAFERANVNADILADRLVQDAGRVADQAADARQCEDLDAEIGRISARLGRAEEALAAAKARWRELWAGIVPEPLSPTEMLAWRLRAAALADQADALAVRRIAAEKLHEKIEGIRPQLQELADRLGLSSLRALDAGLLHGRITERLRDHATAWDAAREAEIRTVSAREAVATAETALADADARRREWSALWRDGLAACALPPSTGFDGASAALDGWAAVPGLVEERDNRLHRIAGMRRDMAAHQAEASRLARTLGVEETEPQRIVAALAERLRLSDAADAARATRLRMQGEAAADRDRAQEAAARVTSRLAELIRRLNLPESTDLPPLVQRLETRRLLLGKLQTRREELARAGEGVPEAELRAGLDGLDVDEIEGRLSQLAQESETLEQDGRIAHSERDRLSERRRTLEGGTGAETATARKGATEIDIRETARRYLRFKLGALLLDAAIERHRTRHQGPLLERAQTLFANLTGGVYEALEQTFDEKDLPTLAGRRSDDGRQVPITLMSEGTADQLFLALRLAYLEDYAGRAEPAPFLGDDIFASFDDRRTGFGLEALAAIGQGVQPILFTHHETVAKAAERILGCDADVIELD